MIILESDVIQLREKSFFDVILAHTPNNDKEKLSIMVKETLKACSYAGAYPAISDDLKYLCDNFDTKFIVELISSITEKLYQDTEYNIYPMTRYTDFKQSVYYFVFGKPFVSYVQLIRKYMCQPNILNTLPIQWIDQLVNTDEILQEAREEVRKTHNNWEQMGYYF